MKKVFLVLTDYYSESHVEKAFSNKGDAEKYSKEQNEKYGTKSKWWICEINVE